MDSAVRVRLSFEDRHILSKPQRSDGLSRSWLLLEPHRHRNISDLSAHLHRTFDLHQSCPNGVLLSMDDFVLPPFESISILKSNDIICVRKKVGKVSDIIKGADAANKDEEQEIVEKQPVLTGVPLLANEEFEKETGGYESEPEVDEEQQSEDTLTVDAPSCSNEVSKKRKASEKLQSSKRKKHRSVASDGVKNDVHTEQVDDESLPKKKSRKKEKLADVKSTPNVESTPQTHGGSNNNVKSTPSTKRDQLQENGKEKEDLSRLTEGTKKVPSRSARRKKSKRQWLREMAKIGKTDEASRAKGILNWKQDRAKAEKKEVVSHSKGLLHWKQDQSRAKNKEVVSHSKGLLHWKQSPVTEVHKETAWERPHQNSDVEEDVVPVVIRPGHIRFEPLEKADDPLQRSQVSLETFQWNGITSKKKGQKWGIENLSSTRRNDYNDANKDNSEMLTNNKEIPSKDSIDFDKLPLLASSPKEGDVIAYRLLELSSSWTPELSSFRIGRVSWYDPISTRIMLMPIPDHPVVTEKLDEDADSQHTDNSLYKEDGSLEVDYTSLADVRIAKRSNLDCAKAADDRVNEAPPGNKEAVSSPVPCNGGKQADAPTPENGKVNLWDRFSEELNSKKAQLSGENGWNQGNTGRSSWSYKALRSSALGPTMAILRSKNNI